jgi:uncharacterized membrane protein YhhN
MMPFEGGVESPANATLIFSCAAALLYGTMAAAPAGLPRTIVKAMAVALLSVLAAMQGGHWLLVLALALSAAGDFFMSRDGERPFLAGMAAFGAAHLAYIALFTTLGGGFGTYAAQPVRGAIAAVVVGLGLGLLALLVRRVGPRMRLPLGAYVVAILGMVCSALTLDAPLVIAGALLFMISDRLLAIETFLLPAISPLRGWIRYAVWPPYYVGQLLITLGLIRL